MQAVVSSLLWLDGNFPGLVRETGPWFDGLSYDFAELSARPEARGSFNDRFGGGVTLDDVPEVRIDDAAPHTQKMIYGDLLGIGESRILFRPFVGL